MINRSQFQWHHGALGAVSLTYDDALPCHFETVAPMLEANGLRGTLNLILSRATFRDHFSAWQEVATHGHELGNHTLFHACRSDPGKERPTQDLGYNLSHYSERRLRDEIELSNFMLTVTDGLQARTFANPCSHTTFGMPPQSLEPVLSDYFVAARGGRTNRAVETESVNYQNLGTCGADQRTFQDVRAEIEVAVARGNWIIYIIHGVGEGTHRLFAVAEEHYRLIAWLGANRERIWTAPMREVAEYLQQFRG